MFLYAIGNLASRRLDDAARKGIWEDINNPQNQLTLNVLAWGMIGFFAIRLAICDRLYVVVDQLMKFRIWERC